MDTIIALDKKLLIFLNSLGSEQWDPFWLGITNPKNWIPLFLIIILLNFKFFGWKKGVFLFFFMVAMAGFSDMFTNIIRGIFERYRPNNDLEINHLLRRLVNPQSYSFTSGHATTSTVIATFTILLLKNKFKYIKFIVLFPIVFAYSRLYLGVHFPIDILTGASIGFCIGFTFYKLQLLISKKLFS